MNEYLIYGDVAYMRIPQGKGGPSVAAALDVRDIGVVHGLKWFACWSLSCQCFYVHATYPKYEKIALHRLLYPTERGIEVDHVHHNGLDNRRSQTHICTHSENLRNKLRPRRAPLNGISIRAQVEAENSWDVLMSRLSNELNEEAA